MSYREREYDDRDYRRDDRDDRDYRRRSPSPVRDYHRGGPPSSTSSSHRSMAGAGGSRGGDYRGSISRGDPYSRGMSSMMGGMMDHHHSSMGYAAAAEGREVCRDFMRGMCTRGSRCPYVHVHPSSLMSHHAPPSAAYLAQPYPAPLGMPAPPPSSSALMSNKPARSGPEVCRDHLFRKNCTRGKQCPYLHVVLTDKDAEAGAAGSKRKRDDDDEEGREEDEYVDIEELEQDNRLLRSENKEVREENRLLREENLRFREDNIRLRKLIEDAKKERHQSPDLNVASPL